MNNPIFPWAGAAVLGLALFAVTYNFSARRLLKAQHRDKNRYLLDITPSMFPHTACECCGGTASHLRYDKEARAMVCKDRTLCRLVMIYTHLLKDVESA